MKKLFIVMVSVVFLFSCSLVTRRDEKIAQEIKPMITAPTTEVAQAAKLKKTITDKNLKKNLNDQELKKRVVMLPIIDKKHTFEAAIVKNALDAFTDNLNAANEFIALDASVLKLDLKKYIKNDSYDLKAIAKDSQSAGVSCLLETRLIDMRFKNQDLAKVDNSSSLKSHSVDFEIVVQARMLNIRSEQELFNTVKTVEIAEESSKIPENITSENFFNKNNELTELLIKDALLDFNIKLTESLKLITWEGRIAALQGEKIYLNVGQISGVQVGDILKVVDDGNEIYDTELGYHLGKVSGKVKGTLEIIGYFGQDGAVGVLHSGAGFKENDRIELYQ